MSKTAQAARSTADWRFAVYPQFSGARDLGLFRIGGSGLGNHLYIWAKALVLAQQLGGVNVFPTWPQLKLGPLLRREPDPRHYIGLFKTVAEDIHGARKLALLAGARRTTVSRVREVTEPRRGLYVIDEGAFSDHFEELLAHRAFIRRELLRRSVKPPPDVARPFIGIHIRFGDFTLPGPGEPTGAVNQRLPLDWYVGRLDAMRQAVGHDAPAVVFSDASAAELGPLLAQPQVELQQGGTALDDLWRMSQSAALIASSSTFSYWAAYLGEAVVVSRAGGWRTAFDLQPREWICTPADQVMPSALVSLVRALGL